ncbi:hypothetical protein BHE74_00055117 [Ensete ventricosum]|nr:hypothetical protein BHE74_00055117 [Ensete ventricosum]RZR89343.1 hypothetical protein BHM03_00017045 [Ensete ventricosum]
MILIMCYRAGIQLWSIHVRGSMSRVTMTIVLLELILVMPSFLVLWSLILVS